MIRFAVKPIAFASVVLLLASCSASSKFMKETNDGIKPDAGTAAVTFYRVSSYAKGMAPVIISADGKYLGEALPKSQFTVLLPAGNHTFICWGEGTNSMKANLKAGKTYFVRVEVHMGAWQARFNPEPVKPNTKEWTEMQEHLKKCAVYVVDREAGQKATVDARKEKAQEVIAKGEDRFKGYKPEEQKTKTLNPEDGI